MYIILIIKLTKLKVTMLRNYVIHYKMSTDSTTENII